MQHKSFFALAGKLGWDDERRQQLIHEYSNGKTTSLKEFAKDNPAEYRQLVAKMQVWSDTARTAQEGGESPDKWRKRCIAVVCKWIDKSNATYGTDKVAYAKGIVSRTAHKESKEFNKLTVHELRTCYNSFDKQLKAYDRAAEITVVPAHLN